MHFYKLTYYYDYCFCYYYYYYLSIDFPCNLFPSLSGVSPLRIFGFVAKKPGSVAENVCHLFAELDPEQPAIAIVNFINKVMLSQRR